MVSSPKDLLTCSMYYHVKKKTHYYGIAFEFVITLKNEAETCLVEIDVLTALCSNWKVYVGLSLFGWTLMKDFVWILKI